MRAMPTSAATSQATHLPLPRAGLVRGEGAHPVAAWLFLCCVLVFAMIVVGGVTRLTHSGLSIVEWQPIVGTIPPLSDADWQAAFAKYQQTPEYRQVNHAMTVAEFKPIFWLEYSHRLLGRAIGAVFLLPLLVYRPHGDAFRPGSAGSSRSFRARWPARRDGLVLVKSGLIDDRRVSQVPADGASWARAHDLRGDVLDRAVARFFPTALPCRDRLPRFERVALLSPSQLGVRNGAHTGGFVAGIRAGFGTTRFR
jgi:cytochrome c oxidase assembly protein subunit 15